MDKNYIRKFSIPSGLTLLAVLAVSYFWIFGVGTWDVLIIIYLVGAIAAVISLVLLFKIFKDEKESEVGTILCLMIINLLALVQPAGFLFSIIVGFFYTHFS